MKLRPLNNNVRVQPMEESGVYSSSQKKYAEKGTVLAVSFENTEYKTGDVIRFHGWSADFYENDEGNDECLVPVAHVIGVYE